MDKALNEIGKLRNEMKVGFIELENQMKSSTETLVKTMSSFSDKVEKGFVAIEEALDTDLEVIKTEIDVIKKRLDKGNL